MSVFFTSDLHIGHAKIAELRSERMGLDEVPQADWVYYHDLILAQNWDAAVGHGDIVYVCGDISSGSTSGQVGALGWLAARPGRKRLYIGNHDGLHPMYRDAAKWEPKYREVFESVQLHGRRRIPLNPEGHVDVLLSHFPYAGDVKDEDRHTQWRLPDKGLYIIHGHTHSGEALSRSRRVGLVFTVEGDFVRFSPGRINQIHVGVDAWDFKPVPLQVIVDIVQKLEDDTNAE